MSTAAAEPLVLISSAGRMLDGCGEDQRIQAPSDVGHVSECCHPIDRVHSVIVAVPGDIPPEKIKTYIVEYEYKLGIFLGIGLLGLYLILVLNLHLLKQ